MNWIEFVKKYSADNNMKYGQCLKDPKCKEQYHAQKNGNKPDEKIMQSSEESFTLAPEMPSESTKHDTPAKYGPCPSSRSSTCESISSTPKKRRPRKTQVMSDKSFNNDISTHFL
jgi:hypothetical protein